MPKNHKRIKYKAKDDYSKVYQFKIKLLEIKPDIWRRIQVPENYTFWDLHVAIQDSMGWTDSHLHEFRVRHPLTARETNLGIPVDEDEKDPNQIFPDWEYRIADIFGEYNTEILYVYDFGDDWRHMVILEGIRERDKNTQYPLCLDGARACPPEDVGSSNGYDDFLEIISDPNHEEYKEYIDWASSQIDIKKGYQSCREGNKTTKFDPEHFDVKKIVFDDPVERIKTLSRN
ncbi:MAG: hypothetical protein A3J83_05055 [Elusimicrobia bacterium RIFOXYA2_FULL_40_6]|nr:MAG: hypothetical protein A3J83_05055 [Elusimicrobia bacterium RIFOXYA2_FULL_40_6]